MSTAPKTPTTRKPRKSRYNLRRETMRESLLRLLELAQTLREHRPCNAAFARERKLSRKTMYRDIDLLRSLGWKIEFDSVENSYDLAQAPRPKIL